MEKGQFCFLSDQYYLDFPDKYLMRNKESVGGAVHGRPCFFVFADNTNKDILWVVPISSQYTKFKILYDKKIARFGRCNTIRFGEVLGTQAAFLIQNMCPVIEKYISEIYVDKDNNPIQIDNRIVQDVIANAREVLARTERGADIVFPDIKTIRDLLLVQLGRD
ncbi:MAG: hypothetical protein LBT12_00760 [Oscillospiraceae bacterium]|jgi:hypothetical protein|nr:hypothetical protein [Oscillospiraceae bacterium]